MLWSQNTVVKKEQNDPIEVPPEILEKWQNIVDIMAELIRVPAALIMRIVDTDIEVFVSSRSQGNPYNPGDHERLFGSGLYCETVIKTNEKLLVPNAFNDEQWKTNPDIKLNMISYLGFPILLPDGKPFGTICVLDEKENAHSELFENLIRNFREIIQSQLGLIYMNHTLGEKNKSLSDYIAEITFLRGLIPICATCKKVKDNDGSWIPIERYIEDHSHAEFCHGTCDECAERL
jgi:transcriptional regulator with GAF, ATPase, and Fis domain